MHGSRIKSLQTLFPAEKHSKLSRLFMKAKLKPIQGYTLDETLTSPKGLSLRSVAQCPPSSVCASVEISHSTARSYPFRIMSRPLALLICKWHFYWAN